MDDAGPRGNVFCIASYNVHSCIGNDARCDVARIAQVLVELRCDLVGLQEVSNRDGGGHDAMQLEFLASATGMQPIPGLTMKRYDSTFGNALLSRRPVRAVRRHDLSYGRREPRGALDVDVEVNGHAVRVIVTHLGLRPVERRHQVRRLLELLDPMRPEAPTVLLGDINEWAPLARPLRWLHARLGQSPAYASFPSWRPTLALDRIWVHPASALVSSSVHRSAAARVASDHLPVTATIAIGDVLPPPVGGVTNQ